MPEHEVVGESTAMEGGNLPLVDVPPKLHCGHTPAYRCSHCGKCNLCGHQYQYRAAQDVFQKKCKMKIYICDRPDYTFAAEEAV